jgi:hypothetical protein
LFCVDGKVLFSLIIVSFGFTHSTVTLVRFSFVKLLSLVVGVSEADALFKSSALTGVLFDSLVFCSSDELTT